MKILYYVPQLYRMGGIERTTTTKANWLVQNGHEVVVFLPEQAGKEIYYELDPKVKVYQTAIPSLKKGTIIQKLIDKQRVYKLLYKELSRIIRIEQPDIGICTDAEKYPLLPILLEKNRTFVEFHTSREAADLGTPFKEKLIGYNALTRFIAHKLRLSGGWNRIAWHYYGQLMVLTQRDKQYWQDTLGVKNIIAIPNPLPFTSPYQSLCSNRVVLAIGRFCHQKNYSNLLKIWNIASKRNSKWLLKLVGNGEYEQDLKTQIDQLDLSESVCLEPATLDVERYYYESSIFCMTSRFEGFPMTLLEAQTMGLPIVSYDCPCGPDEIIENGVTGYLIKPGDEEAFAHKLLHLMEQDELRVQMGEKAYNASHRYSIDKIMSIWLNLFENVLRQTKSKITTK